MKCKLIRDMMGAYLYGDLAPDEMRQVRVHTHECEACRADLAERGRVAASLGNTPPQLSDEDRQRIAWTVTGAVRHSELANQQTRIRWAPAFAVAAVLIAGLAAGLLLSAHVTKPPVQSRADAPKEKAPAAVVEITEEDFAAPRTASREESTSVQDAETPPSSTASGPRRPSTVDRVARAIRRGSTFAAGARKGASAQHENAARPDEPVEIESAPQPAQTDHTNGDLKLPAPTTPDNAQTSPQGKGDSGQGKENTQQGTDDAVE